jgi:hypothetical protein
MHRQATLDPAVKSDLQRRYQKLWLRGFSTSAGFFLIMMVTVSTGQAGIKVGFHSS